MSAVTLPAGVETTLGTLSPQPGQVASVIINRTVSLNAVKQPVGLEAA